MKKMNVTEMQIVIGGGFWEGFCSGFTIGSIGLALVGITLGPLGAAVYASVGAGCAINTVVKQAIER